MADRKISDLTALTTPASGDYLPIVDISEASAANKNKRITIEELLRGAPDGTAGAPGIAFESDPDTGLYSTGANAVAISTGNTGRLFIDSSGRVGVGAASPATTLDVNGDVTITDKIIHGGDTNTAIRFPAADTVSVETGGSERTRIDSSGRLLVGTTSSSAAASLILQGNSSASSTQGILYLSRGVNNPTDALLLGVINFSDSGHNASASIEARRDGGTWTSGSSQPTRLMFSTTADGSSSPTERLRITSAGVLQVADAANITVGTTTGTKIGTGTTQKLGFWNATPVVQPAAVADATDAATVITQLNDLLAKLRTLGIIAT